MTRHSLAYFARGQALTEFLLVALVLLPLFLLLPMIGKISGIAHQAQMASRYAAFDAILRNDSHNSFKPPPQIEDELQRRFFGAAAAIETASPAATFEPRAEWVDPYANALIRAAKDVSLSFGPAHGNRHEDAYTAASDAKPFQLAGAADLASSGIYNVNVEVALANLPAGLKLVEPFDQLNLRIERHASVLLDPWTANSPQQAEQRFGALAPMNGLLQPLEPLVGVAIKLVDLDQVQPPSFGALERWRDVVPADRIAGKEDGQ
jgi:hypothetical protein